MVEVVNRWRAERVRLRWAYTSPLIFLSCVLGRYRMLQMALCPLPFVHAYMYVYICARGMNGFNVRQ
jgi:hypothetical protein